MDARESWRVSDGSGPADENLIIQLEGLAERLGVAVRYAELDTPGGLCEIRGKKTLLINSGLDIEGQAEVLARALAQFELDDLYVVPRIRAWIDFVMNNASERGGPRTISG